MKKLRILPLLLALTLLLCACQKPSEKPDMQPEETPEIVAPQPDVPDDPSAEPDTQPETPDVPAQPSDEPETPEEPAEEEPKVEAPVVEPFTGRWVSRVERTDDTVVIDPNGVIIQLTAQLPLDDVRIERVGLLTVCGDSYDSTYETYDILETLHTVERVEAGDVLELQVDVPLSAPDLAVSWEDEFGERDFRLILTQKFYTDGNASEWCSLVSFREKIRPVEITADMDTGWALDEAELPETEPYSFESFFGFAVEKTQIAAEYHYDIDGNGRKNSIQLLRLTDESGNLSYAVRIVCGNVFYDAENGVSFQPRLWMADLDGDDRAEVYLSGDFASDDYVTQGWKLGRNELEPVLFCGDIRTGDFERANASINGEIVSIANQALTLKTCTHRLGSHYVTQSYTAERDGTLSPAPAQDWVCTDGQLLTVKKALPAFSGGKSVTLAAGTKLTVTAMDATDRVYFRTDSGMQGWIQLEENTDENDWCVWRIDGEKDENYFENLIYAG